MPRIPPDSTTALEIELAAAWPVYRWGRTRQLVAVSGGADSVALLRALLRLAPDPSLIDAAHFNHGWRGDESDGDEYFVRELCQLLGVRLFVERASETLSEAVAHGRSEAEARNLRYDFLARTAYRSGARYVLTAHTASDRVETLLHNLFRGSGLGGVATLGLVRPLDQQLVLARPLISCSREQVLDHLSQLGQPCRQDASNDNLAFRRNYIRHQLLPLLREQYGPQLDARLLSFSELAAEALEAIDELAADYLLRVEALALQRQALPPETGEGQVRGFSFPRASLLPESWPVVRQAMQQVWQQHQWPLQNMSRKHWDKIRFAWEGNPDAAQSNCSARTGLSRGSSARERSLVFWLPGKLRLTEEDQWLTVRG